jgi:hypothetical protein
MEDCRDKLFVVDYNSVPIGTSIRALLNFTSGKTLSLNPQARISAISMPFTGANAIGLAY